MSLAPRLSLPEVEVQEFIQKANSRRRRYAVNAMEVQMIQEIENQKLTQSMEWFHIAILELVSVKGFQANASWVSGRLGITADQAQTALDDLMSSGVLSQREDGVWKSELSNHTVSGKKTPRALLVKKQIYEQAITLLPDQVGNHSTVTVSVSEERLAEATERITRFRRELCQFLAEPEEKSHVYQLLISLFPVSK